MNLADGSGAFVEFNVALVHFGPHKKNPFDVIVVFVRRGPSQKGYRAELFRGIRVPHQNPDKRMRTPLFPPQKWPGRGGAGPSWWPGGVWFGLGRAQGSALSPADPLH